MDCRSHRPARGRNQIRAECSALDNEPLLLLPVLFPAGGHSVRVGWGRFHAFFHGARVSGAISMSVTPHMPPMLSVPRATRPRPRCHHDVFDGRDIQYLE